MDNKQERGKNLYFILTAKNKSEFYKDYSGYSLKNGLEENKTRGKGSRLRVYSRNSTMRLQETKLKWWQKEWQAKERLKKYI